MRASRPASPHIDVAAFGAAIFVAAARASSCRSSSTAAKAAATFLGLLAACVRESITQFIYVTDCRQKRFSRNFASFGGVSRTYGGREADFQGN